MDFFNRLLTLLTSPLGIAAIIVGFGWLMFAMRSATARWIGYGGTMYSASLAKYYDVWKDEEWYPLWGPMETMVDNGRPIAILCLAAVLVLSVSTASQNRSFSISPLMYPIHAIQALVFAKLLFWGSDLPYSLQAGIIYTLVFCIGAFGLRNWVLDDTTLRGPAIALTTAGAIFCMLVEWQLRVDPEAALLSNRLMGTTANPQHAAVFLALTLLGPFYLLFTPGYSPVTRVFLMGILAANFHLLFLTGSRTGLLMAAAILLIFLRRRQLAPILVSMVVIGLIIYGFAREQFTEQLTDFTSRGDTRSAVWSGQWNAFLSNPIFGRENIGARFRIGENSWLGLMEATGLFGLLALLWLIVAIFQTTSSLLAVKGVSFRSQLDADFCLAGLVGIFLGSFLEAYLVGIITMPVLCLLMLAICSEKVLRTKEGQGQIVPELAAGRYR